MNDDVVNPYVESEEHGLARIAYEAYCKSTWKTGAKFPSFNETPNAVQAAWIAASQAVKWAGPKLQERDFPSWLEGLKDKMCLVGRIMFTDCDNYKKQIKH
jgi:hypothetical protein